MTEMVDVTISMSSENRFHAPMNWIGIAAVFVIVALSATISAVICIMSPGRDDSASGPSSGSFWMAIVMIVVALVFLAPGHLVRRAGKEIWKTGWRVAEVVLRSGKNELKFFNREPLGLRDMISIFAVEFYLITAREGDPSAGEKLVASRLLPRFGPEQC